MRSQRNADGPGTVVCASCGSPRVVAMELVTGEGQCLRHHAYSLGYFDGLRDAAINLLDAAVAAAVEGGHVHPRDVSDSLGQAIAAGEARRPRTPQVPTFDQVAEAVAALEAFDRLSDGEESSS